MQIFIYVARTMMVLLQEAYDKCSFEDSCSLLQNSVSY